MELDKLVWKVWRIVVDDMYPLEMSSYLPSCIPHDEQRWVRSAPISGTIVYLVYGSPIGSLGIWLTCVLQILR